MNDSGPTLPASQQEVSYKSEEPIIKPDPIQKFTITPEVANIVSFQADKQIIDPDPIQKFTITPEVANIVSFQTDKQIIDPDPIQKFTITPEVANNVSFKTDEQIIDPGPIQNCSIMTPEAARNEIEKSPKKVCVKSEPNNQSDYSLQCLLCERTYSSKKILNQHNRMSRFLFNYFGDLGCAIHQIYAIVL